MKVQKAGFRTEQSNYKYIPRACIIFKFNISNCEQFFTKLSKFLYSFVIFSKQDTFF